MIYENVDTLKAIDAGERGLYRICASVPASRRMLRFHDKYTETSRYYYARMPEMVFVYNIDTLWGNNNASICLQIFYKDGDFLYPTIFPNQMNNNIICLGNEQTFKISSVGREIEKQTNDFFTSVFNDDFRLSIQRILKDDIFHLSNVFQKPSRFFEYWEDNSKSEEFKIFNCEAVKVKPINYLDRVEPNHCCMCHTRDPKAAEQCLFPEIVVDAKFVSSIPSLSDLMKTYKSCHK